MTRFLLRVLLICWTFLIVLLITLNEHELAATIANQYLLYVFIGVAIIETIEERK